MTRHPAEWDRSFVIDSRAAACRFVESLWNEEHVPPVRIHARGPAPRDLGGSPRWSGAFAAYIFASPDEVEPVDDTSSGVTVTRYYYRYPLWRSLSLLSRRQSDRWTKGVPARPFHPKPTAVLEAMADADFRPELVVIRYLDGTVVPNDMADLFIIGAARKLRGVYALTYVPWTERSESQRNAIDDSRPAA